MKLEPDFKKFWLGTSVSIFGSTITEFALPLTAAQILNASPTQMGALAAVQWLPTLLLGLFVGVWVDQRRRKPVMMTSDLLRGITLSAVPIATLFGQLNMTLLLIVAVLHGIFSVLELVAYPAYLPTLVGREHITEANSRINLSMSSAQVMGPSLAGVLAQIISAPFTIAFDALSFVFSAACLSAIRKPEPLPEYVAHADGPVASILEGMRFVWQRPLLRILLIMGIISNIGWGIYMAVNILFLIHDLRLDSAQIGIVSAAVGIGSIAGSLIASRVARRIGMPRTIAVGASLFTISSVILPFVRGEALWVMVALVFCQLLNGLGSMLWNINIVSMRQMITPTHLLGRVNAAVRTLVIGMFPIGSLIGGWLGEAIGLRGTIGVFAAITIISTAIVWLSPSVRNAQIEPTVS